MSIEKSMQALTIDTSGDGTADKPACVRSKSLGMRQNSPSSCESGLANSSSTVSSIQQPAAVPIVAGSTSKYVRRQRRKSANMAPGISYDSGSEEHIHPSQAIEVADKFTNADAGESPTLIEPTPPETRGRKLSGTILPSDMIFYPDDDFQGVNMGIKTGLRKNSVTTGDRKKRSVVSLNITKNGGGGKFTWGRPGDEWKTHCPSGVRDSKDPNFDEYEEDENTFFDTYRCNYTDEDICQNLQQPFQEYLINGDERELVRLITIMQSNQINENVLSRIFFHVFLWGLEAKRTHRGHVWSLNSTILDRPEIKQANISLCTAFENFFDARREILLDCPDYDDYLQKLVACFLYKTTDAGTASDLTFFEKFLHDQIKQRADKFGEVMRSAMSIANRLKSDLQILSTIWTIDDYLTTEQLSLAMSKLVDDWAAGGYSFITLADELAEYFKTPNFYHELVYQLLKKCVHNGSSDCLKYCVQSLEYLVLDRAIVSKAQVNLGFERLYKEMDELAVDVPSVHVLVGLLVKYCYQKKLVNDQTRVKLPKKKGDRRRIMSAMCYSNYANQ